MSRSWIDENLDTQYTMFLLQGETAIVFGLRSPMTPDTLRLNDFVAVGVKQRQCTPLIWEDAPHFSNFFQVHGGRFCPCDGSGISIKFLKFTTY